jgi:hypothetical protein
MLLGTEHTIVLAADDGGEWEMPYRKTIVQAAVVKRGPCYAKKVYKKFNTVRVYFKITSKCGGKFVYTSSSIRTAFWATIGTASLVNKKPIYYYLKNGRVTEAWLQ